MLVTRPTDSPIRAIHTMGTRSTAPRATMPVGQKGRAIVSAEPSSFGGLLRRYRTATRLTPEELAERAGLSARRIQDLERGLRFGVDERITKLDPDGHVADGRRSKRRAYLTRTVENRVSPAILFHKVANAVFLRLCDVAESLPPYNVLHETGT
jgi:helix-turn-helix protein